MKEEKKPVEETEPEMEVSDHRPKEPPKPPEEDE